MTLIFDEIDKLRTNLTNSYTAVSNCGATLPQARNFDNLSATINSISGAGGKYSLFERIKDDSNNEIGTVSGFFKDSNNNKYAVVCLDARYRGSGLKVSDDTSEDPVTNLEILNNQLNTYWYRPTSTATSNCDKILAFCSANSATSTAINHCRNLSFVIDSITYYGQLPNIKELFDISLHFSNLELLDTTSSSYSSLNFSSARNYSCSNGRGSGRGWWTLNSNGNIRNDDNRSSSRNVIPILEIPNN